MKIGALLAAALLVMPAAALAWPGRPVGSVPQVAGAHAPPRAWIETATRSWWLAYSSYCWQTTCADFLPPQSRRDLPVVRVPRGAAVRIHLAFAPAEVHVTVFRRTSLTHVRLRAARVAVWRPTHDGVVSVDVRGPGGSASYATRVDVT